MAKVIKYNICNVVSYETQDGTQTEEILLSATLEWSEANEEIAKLEAYNSEYTIEDDGVEQTPAEKIEDLKKQLAATDYQIIKCSECQLVGAEMPYDVEQIHAERQAIRDEINRLEQEE